MAGAAAVRTVVCGVWCWREAGSAAVDRPWPWQAWRRFSVLNLLSTGPWPLLLLLFVLKGAPVLLYLHRPCTPPEPLVPARLVLAATALDTA
jgi:hypothetical protein